MVRMLNSLAVLALLAAGGVSTLCILQWGDDTGPADGHVLDGPSVIELFKQQNAARGPAPQNRATPLMVQAEAFASYLNPPKPAKVTKAALTSKPPVLLPVDSRTTPRIRPAAPSAHFKLHGTSYYPNQPERSMALIAQRSGTRDTARWVREGSQVGHFVIHEIRASAIVYRDGEQLRELAVAGRPARKSLVRRTRSDTRQISAAAVEAGAISPLPAGPNSVGIAGQQ
jgi:hypothetical protein